MKKKIIHNKLVRDNIPDVLKVKNIEAEVEVITDAIRLERLLLDKLSEEAQEAGYALDDQALLGELADMESVIDGILLSKGWNREQLELKKAEKDIIAGKFNQKFFLVSTTEEVKE